MNYSAEFDFWLGILLKHSFRERFLMQHKLSWQLLQMVWPFPSFYFFLSSFRLNTGYWAVYAEWRNPNPSSATLHLPNMHLSVSTFMFNNFSNVELHHVIPLFHTLNIYINIFVFTVTLCYLTPRNYRHWKQDRCVGNSFTRLQEPPKKFTWAVLQISTHVWIGKHSGEGVIGSS